MGEIAEEYVEGGCCFRCMTYFVKDHGYPVLCNACWKQALEDGDVQNNGKRSQITKSDGTQKAIFKEAP